MLGFSILSASIASSAVRDRVTGAKRLQHISGLGYGTYWFANFLYDMVGFGENIRPASCQGLSKCVCVCVLFWGRSLQGWPRFQGPQSIPSSLQAFVCHPFTPPAHWPLFPCGLGGEGLLLVDGSFSFSPSPPVRPVQSVS